MSNTPKTKWEERFDEKFGDEHFVRSWGYEECACDWDEFKNKGKPKCMDAVKSFIRQTLQEELSLLEEKYASLDSFFTPIGEEFIKKSDALTILRQHKEELK